MSKTTSCQRNALQALTMTDSREPAAIPPDHPSEPSADSKRGVRAEMRAALAAMSDDERRDASSAATAKLIALDEFRAASTVMLYMPLAGEVDTTHVAIRVFQLGKTVCVPKVDWARRDMYAIEVNSLDDHYMETDDHGIRIPRAGRPIVPRSIDLVVVPGLAFDTYGRRLGRGGGFYDRFLSRLRRSATTVGLAFDRQVVDEVPVQEHDVSVDAIVTERRATYTRRSRSTH
ncbi:MAG: 5-formyltetrahydrofolate cyclo-ligase [Phycisphaerales bacterium]|nr:5-formyltetrahydrofolate cyclo-ligase [Phycisphaerae bacterium]NNF44569.1 5-formyltetrahydrofolate cyclo-ligase [Phycisphaerales bacterium]NNM26301.1 5-formyltetrahydrofolate cyclo-ligase [Phycisphaerales bacterium]